MQSDATLNELDDTHRGQRRGLKAQKDNTKQQAAAQEEALPEVVKQTT
jgi:hypothetical protein